MSAGHTPSLSTKLQAFLQEVSEDLDRYVRFEGERFSEFRCGVLTGTEPDTQGDQLDLPHLEEMVRQHQQRGTWTGYQHDPLHHMVGRVLAVRLVEDSSHHYILGITGVYEQQSYPSFADLGLLVEDNEIASANGPAELDASVVLCVNPHCAGAGEIAQLLNGAPRLVAQEIRPRFEKAVTPLTIVTILVAIHLASTMPFVKKLQECAAEDLWKWLKRVFGLLPSRLADRVVLEVPAESCTVRFVNAARSASAVHDATSAVPTAFTHARLLLEHPAARELQLELLVYEWLEDEKRWLPSHACSRTRGVISDKRRLAAMEAVAGFSPSGYGSLPTAEIATRTEGTDDGESDASSATPT